MFEKLALFGTSFFSPNKKPEQKRSHRLFENLKPNRVLQNDIFQKSKTTTQTQTKEQYTSNLPSIAEILSASPTGVLNKTEVEQIYNDVWEDIASSEPMVKELNIKKPALLYKNNPQCNMGYIPLTNSIALPPVLFENQIYFFKNNTDNRKILLLTGDKDTFKDIYTQLQAKYPNGELIPFNKDDAKLYTRGVIAHEIRHCMQIHSLLASEDCREKFLEKTETLIAFNALKLCGEFARIATSTGQAIDLEDAYSQIFKKLSETNDYCKNYKPPKFLPKYARFKFGSFEDAETYVSIKQHFLTDFCNDMQTRNYRISPMEADANKFEFDYLTAYLKQKDNDALNSDTASAILTEPKDKYTYTLEHMSEYGLSKPDELKQDPHIRIIIKPKTTH